MPLLCPYCNRFEYEEGIGCATCTVCTLLIHRVGEEGFSAADHRWLGGELNRLLGEVSGRLLLRQASSQGFREEARRTPRSRSPPKEGIRLSEGFGGFARPPASPRSREAGRRTSERPPASQGGREEKTEEGSRRTRKPPEPPAPPPNWRPSLRDGQPRSKAFPDKPPARGSLGRAWGQETPASGSRASPPRPIDLTGEEKKKAEKEPAEIIPAHREERQSREESRGAPKISSDAQEVKKGKAKGKGGGKGKPSKRKKKNKGVKRAGWWQLYLERKGLRKDSKEEAEAAEQIEAEELEEEEETIDQEENKGGAVEVAERLERWADVETAGGETED